MTEFSYIEVSEREKYAYAILGTLIVILSLGVVSILDYSRYFEREDFKNIRNLYKWLNDNIFDINLIDEGHSGFNSGYYKLNLNENYKLLLWKKKLFLEYF